MPTHPNWTAIATAAPDRASLRAQLRELAQDASSGNPLRLDPDLTVRLYGLRALIETGRPLTAEQHADNASEPWQARTVAMLALEYLAADITSA